MWPTHICYTSAYTKGNYDDEQRLRKSLSVSVHNDAHLSLPYARISLTKSSI